MGEKYISVFAAVQAKPEFLNENHENKDSALYAKGWNACNSAFIDNLLAIPAAEVRPVKRGEWMDMEDTYADPPARQTCRCSNCGKVSPRPLGDFCRWCGADMRRKEEQ